LWSSINSRAARTIEIRLPPVSLLVVEDILKFNRTVGALIVARMPHPRP
jgi:hypothetical protein